MSIWGAFFGPSRVELERREAFHQLTLKQIEEAQCAVRELSEVKESLVRQANGALYELKTKKGAAEDGAGDETRKL